MVIALIVLAVTYAAFSVWLGVRIVNRRERWAKRTLATVVSLPVLYVAAFGPLCWWDSRQPFDIVDGEEFPVKTMHWPLPDLYRPMLAIGCENTTIYKALMWYANLGAPRNRVAFIGLDSSDPGGVLSTAELLWEKQRGPRERK